MFNFLNFFLKYEYTWTRLAFSLFCLHSFLKFHFVQVEVYFNPFSINKKINKILNI